MVTGDELYCGVVEDSHTTITKFSISACEWVAQWCSGVRGCSKKVLQVIPGSGKEPFCVYRWVSPFSSHSLKARMSG